MRARSSSPCSERRSVLPSASPRRRSRSPSPSMSAKAGAAKLPTLAIPNGATTSVAKTAARELPVFRRKCTPSSEPTKALRSPSPSMSAKTGVLKTPTSVVPERSERIGRADEARGRCGGGRRRERDAEQARRRRHHGDGALDTSRRPGVRPASATEALELPRSLPEQRGAERDAGEVGAVHRPGALTAGSSWRSARLGAKRRGLLADLELRLAAEAETEALGANHELDTDGRGRGLQRMAQPGALPGEAQLLPGFQRHARDRPADELRVLVLVALVLTWLADERPSRGRERVRAVARGGRLAPGAGPDAHRRSLRFADRRANCCRRRGRCWHPSTPRRSSAWPGPRRLSA